MSPEFVGYNKISRLKRPWIVTEKIDGTNACVYVTEQSPGEILKTPWADVVWSDKERWVYAASRKRWVTVENDNYGWAWFVKQNGEALAYELGLGRHYGEWFGYGINRNYKLPERRFALFDPRWNPAIQEHPLLHSQLASTLRPTWLVPAICDVVPLLGVIPTDQDLSEGVNTILGGLQQGGSRAAPGFDNPEGIVVTHSQNPAIKLKVLCENDHAHKGQVKEMAGVGA